MEVELQNTTTVAERVTISNCIPADCNGSRIATKWKCAIENGFVIQICSDEEVYEGCYKEEEYKDC